MNNSKRNVHSSGALGMLLKEGQIAKIDDVPEKKAISSIEQLQPYFKTKTGIVFNENQLMYVDVAECEPWEYANRLDGEIGDIEGLMNSIVEQGQLQPALVRPHPKPDAGIKYEIIFGRRRHLACVKLGIKFLVINKEITDLQDAVASQDAENKQRKNVSNYSNALLYKRLLQDKVFKNEKELAAKLDMSPSSFTELMAYTKIPQDIVKKLPDIHSLSNNMVLKIVSLINENYNNNKNILEISPKIGISITSPAKLESALNALSKPSLSDSKIKKYLITSNQGKELFTFKLDQKGTPSIVFDKGLSTNIDHEKLCNHLRDFLESVIQ